LSAGTEAGLAEGYLNNDFDLEGDIEAAFECVDVLLGRLKDWRKKWKMATLLWYECRDHRVPIDWLGNHRHYAAGDVVSACRECSVLPSNFSKVTLSSRTEYLIRAYEKRAAKWLRAPPWSERELQEMGYSMQNQICKALMVVGLYLEGR
jgi:hypothetical protein